jgi:GT2 family glycosyltransferase/glycosyltransferase involved in cell wall biosynthesis
MKTQLNQSSFLVLANDAMRKHDYARAIVNYERSMRQYPAFSKNIAINLEIARKRQQTEFPGIDDSARRHTPESVDDENILVQEEDYNEKYKNSLELKGYIDLVDETGIHGWIYDDKDLKSVVSLDIILWDKKILTVVANIPRHDVKAAGHLKTDCGFYIDHRPYVGPADFAVIKICLSGTLFPLFDGPITLDTLPAKIDGLSRLARLAKQQLIEQYSSQTKWVSVVLLPWLIQQARVTAGQSLPIQLIAPNEHQDSKRDNAVDVIIPVYEGYDETFDCINSVLKSKNNQPYRLIVINDASPNSILSAALKVHAARSKYILLENENNLGFVGTVNRGMSLDKANDVILLNADTLVPDHWLDQLVEAAFSDSIIGTVTPFSNNATICSYPNFCQDNSLPEGHDVNDMNRIFRKFNQGKVLDLPTAHGFCMLIKRAVLHEVGLFDENKWGKGYGEENDFSLRAEQYGWRNVMALDTFVQHLGAVSFGENSANLKPKNLGILNDLYPDFSARVSHFILNDPVKSYRDNVSFELLRNELSDGDRHPTRRGTSILFVSLSIGGGIQVATEDLSRHLASEGYCTFLLSVIQPGIWRVSSHQTNVYKDYSWPQAKDMLISDFKTLRVRHIHYHQTLQFPKEVWEFPELIECKYDITLHDYYTICPRANLINETRRYCAEPSLGVCNACIRLNGVHESSFIKFSDFGHSISQWRTFYSRRMAGARKIFTPSEDTANRLRRYFPSLTFSVRPHPEAEQEVCLNMLSTPANVNVAFLGAIGVHKGFDYLIGCARHAHKHALPITFHLIGYSADDEMLKELTNIKIHGKYSRNELPKIIKNSRCDIAALLSVGPETFSYTLSEALRAGMKVLAFDLGATAGRIPPGAGLLIDVKADFGEICAHLVDLAKLPNTSFKVGHEYRSYIDDYYDFQLRP